MTVHAFVDESARADRYLIAAAIVDPAHVGRLRQSMRALLMPGQRELHFKKEKPTRRRCLADAIARLPVEVCVYTRSCRRSDESTRQVCLDRLVCDLVDRRAHRLVIDSRNEQDIHDERTLRRRLGPLPSASQLVYEHVDSTSEALLWIADVSAWCFGASAGWRKRIDPIVTKTVNLARQRKARDTTVRTHHGLTSSAYGASASPLYHSTTGRHEYAHPRSSTRSTRADLVDRRCRRVMLRRRECRPTLMRVSVVLLAEDDAAIADPLSRALNREGYDVQVVADGHRAFETANGGGVDLLVLDLGLPGIDGLDVCRRLRAAGRSLPVLMLTARADEVDFVVGLDAGADDYVAKPFRLAELLARIRALLRRQAPGTIEVNGVKMDLAARLVIVDGDEVTLANKEFELLRVLIQRAGQVVTREEILGEVWGGPELRTSKTLDMHMSWLRRKLAKGGSRIATVRGVGFRFNTPD